MFGHSHSTYFQETTNHPFFWDTLYSFCHQIKYSLKPPWIFNHIHHNNILIGIVYLYNWKIALLPVVSLPCWILYESYVYPPCMVSFTSPLFTLSVTLLLISSLTLTSLFTLFLISSLTPESNVYLDWNFFSFSPFSYMSTLYMRFHCFLRVKSFCTQGTVNLIFFLPILFFWPIPKLNLVDSTLHTLQAFISMS